MICKASDTETITAERAAGIHRELPGHDITALAAEPDMYKLIQQSTEKLLDYCKKHDWAGFDPYDGLSSKIFSSLPLAQNKLCRLVLTQAMKRLPVNLRTLFLVPREHNPKAIALFISALIRLQDIDRTDETIQITRLINKLTELRSPGWKQYCWGYNFDWQSRRFLTEKYTPNIICTTFAAHAFLDAFDIYAKGEYLDIAISAGEFLLSGLKISTDSTGSCFSYTPLQYDKVHNANLLGAALLARLYKATGNQRFLDYATPAVNYSVAKQNDDGSWFYGEHGTQRWVDNFHTGYNLVALNSYCKYTGIQSCQENIERGYVFYRNNFFTETSIPKYFHNRIYPVDIHCVAQGAITLTEMQGIDPHAQELRDAMLLWAFKSMQSDEGYFFYQQGRFFKNRISYMRWSQAWMLYALGVCAQAMHGAAPTANSAQAEHKSVLAQVFLKVL